MGLESEWDPMQWDEDSVSHPRSRPNRVRIQQDWRPARSDPSRIGTQFALVSSRIKNQWDWSPAKLDPGRIGLGPKNPC